MDARAAEIVAELQLAPHPEGGHFREIWRSELQVQRGDARRSALTVIWFLLAAGECSRWHVVASDEVWQFAGGDALELLTFDPGAGRVSRVKLGPGERLVFPVGAGVWQAARPLGRWTLVTCTVGPGFDFEDFRFVRDLAGHEHAFEGALAGTEDLL